MRRKLKPLRTFHLDRRAEQILAADPPGIGHNKPPADDDLLTSEQVALWFGVSTQWLEVGRCKGYGPKVTRLGTRVIRYTLGDVRAWLRQRIRRRLAEVA